MRGMSHLILTCAYFQPENQDAVQSNAGGREDDDCGKGHPAVVENFLSGSYEESPKQEATGLPNYLVFSFFSSSCFRKTSGSEENVF